jgi:hypothetical protein
LERLAAELVPDFGPDFAPDSRPTPASLPADSRAHRGRAEFAAGIEKSCANQRLLRSERLPNAGNRYYITIFRAAEQQFSPRFNGTGQLGAKTRRNRMQLGEWGRGLGMRDAPTRLMATARAAVTDRNGWI